MSDEIVRYRLEDAIAVIEMDDGKVNAISHSMIAALVEAKRLATLDAGAFHATKAALRSDTIARIRAEEGTLPR